MVSRSLFLFPFYKRHFVFFTVINIYMCRTYVLWIGRPRKYRYSRWNFTNMLFLTEGFTIFGILVCRSMSTHLHTLATTMNKTRIWYKILPVLDGYRTILGHIFRSYISVHFRNLFASHIALPVTSRNHIHSIFRSSAHENMKSRWKCLLLLIGRFRIRHATFRDFLWIPRHHVEISDRDVTELYTAINSPRSPWQCLKSAMPYLFPFSRYEGRSGLGHFTPPPQQPGYGLMCLLALKKTLVYWAQSKQQKTSNDLIIGRWPSSMLSHETSVFANASAFLLICPIGMFTAAHVQRTHMYLTCCWWQLTQLTCQHGCRSTSSAAVRPRLDVLQHCSRQTILLRE